MQTIIDNHPALDSLKADLAKIEEQVVTGYTLADAIREGSKVTPQAFNTYRAGDATCALSTGLLAAKARGYIS